MSPNSEFYIFRDSRRRASAADLVDEVRNKLFQSFPSVFSEGLLSLLLRAGELECGLCDAQDASVSWDAASRLTDLFAEAATASDGLTCDKNKLTLAALPILDRIRFSGEVSLAVPEGFAHYALHPLDYADLVSRLNLNTRSVLVVGVRSIGVTLSAVVAAKLRHFGVAAERFTVRPTGHPYDRQCIFDAAQRHAIATALTATAEFLICDEGPGRSGSSLLSVAEALEKEGVPASRIAILCSHVPDVRSLCTPDAARRWNRFRVAAVGMTRRLPADATKYLGGGEWRRALIPEGHPWPAVWPQMERLKYGSRGRALLTFEGHGTYGSAVRARNKALAGCGFGPDYLGQEVGFGRQVIQKGRPAGIADLTPLALRHLARYCAWRAAEFAVADADSSELEMMTRVNFEREFEVALDGLLLHVERPTICDARMMPHGWLLVDDGRWLKLDAAIHGDDHFFPGPCDIAWDLAGAVVEWNLSRAARQTLLAEYRKASGDDAEPRIRNYELAYTTFRMAWSKMAAGSVGTSDDAERLFSDYQRYRQRLEVHQTSAKASSDALSNVQPGLLASTHDAIPG